MLTPEREADLREWAKPYLVNRENVVIPGTATTLAIAALLQEIDRLRAENQELRSHLHCELCTNTGELEDGRNCPRCKPDLSKALSLGK